MSPRDEGSNSDSLLILESLQSSASSIESSKVSGHGCGKLILERYCSFACTLTYRSQSQVHASMSTSGTDSFSVGIALHSSSLLVCSRPLSSSWLAPYSQLQSSECASAPFPCFHNRSLPCSCWRTYVASAHYAGP